MFKEKVIYQIFGIILIGFLLTRLSTILIPFIVALVLAYLLNPSVEFLSKLKLPRGIGTLIVLSLFFAAFGMVGLFIIPILFAQFTKISELLAAHNSLLNKNLFPNLLKEMNHFSPQITQKLQQSLSEFSGQFINFALTLTQNIFHSGYIAFTVLSLLLITPIVTYYLLRDFPKAVNSFKNLIPKKYSKSSQQLFDDLNITISGYLRGQLAVCMILSLYYAIALSFAGLESGIAVGFLSGMLTFIPYVGAAFSAILASLVALLQFLSLKYTLLVLTIYIVGQALEGSFITPKLIGDKVGLHPVWIMFGLLAGGALLGFLGILIAVPLTAAIGVVIKFVLSKYKQSEFYNN